MASTSVTEVSGEASARNGVRTFRVSERGSSAVARMLPVSEFFFTQLSPSTDRCQASVFDNAVAESFFSTLKNELTLHERFATRAAARAAIYEFIELYYNPVRQHSYLHGLSPMEFESARLR